MTGTSIEMPAANRVYQRGPDGTATIAIKVGNGAQARVMQGERTVIPWRAADGAVHNVPAGGPYTIEVDTAARKRFRFTGILVGDLWVLAGQSNMDGCGKLLDLEPASRMVHAFYCTERWAVAKDPLCVLVDSIDPVHWPCEEKDLPRAREEDHKFREYGGGPGVTFGKALYKATGVPIGLVVCSHGGTAIEQWDPALKHLGPKSLYGSMLRRVQACAGKVTGILWYQGESNACPETSNEYKARMKAFIEAMRRDFHAPRLPVIQTQLSRFFVDELVFPAEHWNRIQQAQIDLESEMDNVATVAAIDAHLSDAVHIDTPSARRLGARMAEVALVMAYGRKGHHPLRPDAVRFTDLQRTELRITYKNVRGRLSPSSDVKGFWVEDAHGKRVAIVSAETRGLSVVLKLEAAVDAPAKLWYGRGCNPITNLHDNLFAAPVFGPMTV